MPLGLAEASAATFSATVSPETFLPLSIHLPELMQAGRWTSSFEPVRQIRSQSATRGGITKYCAVAVMTRRVLLGLCVRHPWTVSRQTESGRVPQLALCS